MMSMTLLPLRAYNYTLMGSAGVANGATGCDEGHTTRIL